MNKAKLFAPFLTLLSVGLSLLVMLKGDYTLRDMAVRLLLVLILFYVIGLIIQNKVIKFMEANEQKLLEEAEKEGAVIEKDAPEMADESEKEEEEYKLPPLTGAMPKRPGEDETDGF